MAIQNFLINHDASLCLLNRDGYTIQIQSR